MVNRRLFFGVQACLLILGSLISLHAWAEDQGFVYTPGGRRDPFVPRGIWSPFEAQVVTYETDLEGIVLEGIVWDGERPLAIVNGEILAEGEMVGDFMLDAVDPDKIVLRIGEELHIIELVEEGE